MCSNRRASLPLDLRCDTRLHAMSYITYSFVSEEIAVVVLPLTTRHRKTYYSAKHCNKYLYTMVKVYLSPCLKLINNRGNSCRQSEPKTAVSSSE